MERGKKTGFILKQFKKKNKRLVNKDLFTEFFYLNRERRVIEFLEQNDQLMMDTFFKQFLHTDLKDFIQIKTLNDLEEEIKTWYYEQENLLLIIEVNWGFKKQEISVDINVENFVVTVLDENENVIRKIDYVLLNDYIISFLTLQARNISQIYENMNASDSSNDEREASNEDKVPEVSA